MTKKLPKTATGASLKRRVRRLARGAAKNMIGEMCERVIFAGNEFLCEKSGNTFCTLKGLVRLKVGDVVTHNGNPLLITEHIEDQHFITFRTRQQPSNQKLIHDA